MKFSLFIVISYLAFACCQSQTKHIMSNQGESCLRACADLGLFCSHIIDTSNSTSLFESLGISCKTGGIQEWWALDQPCYVSEQREQNYGVCLGYTKVPTEISCISSHPSVRRLCKCESNIEKTVLLDSCSQSNIDEEARIEALRSGVESLQSILNYVESNKHKLGS